MIQNCGADIDSINETHLSGQNQITIDGWKWKGFNRTETHKRAPKASGRVGLLIKDWIFEQFDTEIIDKSCEGIIGISFTSKTTAFKFLIFSCYLPPENSVWGRDAQSFYAHLMSQIYLQYDYDLIFLCGDLNARIGSLSDNDSELDEIPTRCILDKTTNQHGHSLIEFLNDAKFCVLNGRFDQAKDNFTFIHTRGKSVVDYICIPHDVLSSCKSFEVIHTKDIVDAHNLHSLLGDRSKLPDHALLITEFTALLATKHSNIQSENDTLRFKLNRIPDDMFQSETCALAIIELIENIEIVRETQSEVDNMYNRVCNLILTEMKRNIPTFDATRKSRRRYKHNKPYWNDELSGLWKIMRDKERIFLKCTQGKQIKHARRQEYKSAQDLFDKRLRQLERQYKRSLANDIETLSSNNPNEFWNKIKNLGPRKSRDVPIEIVNEKGDSDTTEDNVFNRWKNDFEKLYNSGDGVDFDETFYNVSKNHKMQLEDTIDDPLYTSNHDLNCNFTLDEISCVIMNAKNKSAVGIDFIPYDVLKYPPIITLLHSFFQLVFDTGIIPLIWRKSIIFPIHKDSTTDKRLPMNYRGISLLSCISKLYSNLINRRLSKYLEDNDILAEEQNGFRRARSCEDHIFTPNSIIRNNKLTFATFIDLKKGLRFR